MWSMKLSSGSGGTAPWTMPYLSTRRPLLQASVVILCSGRKGSGDRVMVLWRREILPPSTEGSRRSSGAPS